MAGIILNNRRGLRWAAIVGLTIMNYGCASTEQLFPEYNSAFCETNSPVAQTVIEPLAIPEPVVQEKVVIMEVPASIRQLTWEPAVYFDNNRAVFNEAAHDTLQNNLAFLKAFPLYRLSVRGFTDQHAATEYNRKLSEDRTKSVVSFFLDKGIAKTRIIARAHGESIALSGDISPVADEISRRVEMILLDVHGRPAATQRNIEHEPAE